MCIVSPPPPKLKIPLIALFPFSDFLGCGRIALKDLLQEGDSPWAKQVLLEDVQSGEIDLILELTLNKSDLLL